ncbi:MAG: hemolysin family protein [Lachnospiraceae bacterium]|nr:hemolysin family protein [Lachnospiraceae bacterium]
MDPSDLIHFLILIILLFLSAFFSSSETALTAVNKVRIKNMMEEGNKKAKIVFELIDEPSRMLSAILIGNNLVNIGMTSYATVFATRFFGNAGAGIATGILTLLIIILGEIIPKNYAASQAEKWSLACAKWIFAWMKFITPISFIVNGIARFLLSLGGIDMDKKQDTFTETEIRTIVDESHEDGEIESDERKMINNVFDLDDQVAKDIMIPRVDMVFLPIDATYEETLETYRECLYTRIPVYEENRDNVVGLINIKDLVLYEDKEHFDIKHILREIYFVHDHKKTSELMREMRQNSISLAIVLDEYGSTAGLITMEDLLEEIVGEIRDEYDENEAENIQEIGEREYVVDGSLKLDDLKDQIGLQIESEEFDSIGGVFIQMLDRFPIEGETVETESGIRLVAENVEKNHIDKVHVYIPEHLNTPEESEEQEES